MAPATAACVIATLLAFIVLGVAGWWLLAIIVGAVGVVGTTVVQAVSRS